ncbi:S8 family serine peptidase [Aquimarina sp. ERC-38]|uniref:S8 family serine peptidase n=1 Tax=Aquimarina sp. ERC-38 TaxID=2949996 RepID=UPI002245E044|nr:S8 family serine peptidase [Aquimarina sp. ERC-38]UZO81708.1 S8 family serine peptidase [Aquimarina sp. ERC-38]
MRKFSILLILFSLVTHGQTLKNKDHYLSKQLVNDIKFKECIIFIKDCLVIKATPSVVAVLDSDMDINHKGLKPFIWKNPQEVIDGIDNDQNGYIDDLNGWNFIGQKCNGESLVFTSMEETRILRKYSKNYVDSLFSNNTIPYQYEDVKKSFESLFNAAKETVDIYGEQEGNYTLVIDTLKILMNKEDINRFDLINYKTNNDTIQNYLNFAKHYYDTGFPYKQFIKELNFNKKVLQFALNLNYDNRDLIGDQVANINDKTYGSPKFNLITDKISHGTEIAGVIASLLTNGDSSLFLSEKLQIMPIIITGNGDPTDKDIALAIRYAVNQGVKVINLSQTKTFSITENFIDNALAYAEKKDVLIVKSAGNESINLDKKIRYPNDIDNNNKELYNNMIVVGSSTKNLDSTLLDSSSNYGKDYVDIFVPTDEVKTFLPNDKLSIEDGGTSYAAPIIATLALLIRSYYPTLTAPEVKEIIMKSGTPYDINVEITREDGSKEMVPFSSLSKSGKIVNAYNAIKMAEKISKRQLSNN